MKLTTLFVLALSIATAQTAKVVEISSLDAGALRAAEKIKDDAARIYDDEVKRIEAKYLVVGDRDKECSNSRYFGRGDTLFITGTSGSLKFYSIGSSQPDPKVEPCYYSYQSVACLEKQLAEARVKEAVGKKPEPTPHYRYWRAGFENGYEFAEGYRYVVPKPKVYESSPRWWGGTYLTPNSPAVTLP